MSQQMHFSCPQKSISHNYVNKILETFTLAFLCKDIYIYFTKILANSLSFFLTKQNFRICLFLTASKRIITFSYKEHAQIKTLANVWLVLLCYFFIFSWPDRYRRSFLLKIVCRTPTLATFCKLKFIFM